MVKQFKSYRGRWHWLSKRSDFEFYYYFSTRVSFFSSFLWTLTARGNVVQPQQFRVIYWDRKWDNKNRFNSVSQKKVASAQSNKQIQKICWHNVQFILVFVCVRIAPETAIRSTPFLNLTLFRSHSFRRFLLLLVSHLFLFFYVHCTTHYHHFVCIVPTF